MTGLNWPLVGAAAITPLVVALPMAYLLWRRGHVLMGNACGIGIVFVACLVFAGADYGMGIQYRMACETAGLPCPPSNPSDFVRMAVFGFIAMAQAMVVFIASLRLEERYRRSQYAPNWRGI